MNAEQVAENRLSSGGGNLRHRAAATVRENLFTQQFKRNHTHAAEPVEARRARQLALCHERRLLRYDPVDRRPQRVARDGVDDRAEATMRLAGSGSADHKADGHRMNSPLTA